MAAKTGVQADRIRRDSAGFALPTILISSIVMLIVLLVSVTATASVRTALKSQYYEQLAQAAGEAGVAYAEACLNANGGVPQWSNASPLKPNTDCTGTELVACPTTSTNPLCSVARNDNIRSSFSIGLPPVVAPSALVVAGGGSGGGSTGGGGGAGGVVYSSGTAVAVGAYPVVVGAGGPAPGNQLPGISGSDSSFNSIVAKGGGGGGYSAGGTSGGAGQDGGSGGGGQNYYSTFSSGLGTGGQGTNGGGLGSANAAGGGGAGGGGGTGPSTNVGGVGGVGRSFDITGVSVFYGGGGGGGNGGAGGNGGGGAGGNVLGTAGTANTGGGGGGGWAYAGGNGGAGGSGVVVVRYPTGTITASGGTVTTVGSDTVHRFTASGTFTVSAISNTLQTIPNTGFVELLRNSNSAVWRTYQQKSAPTAAVPDLCSGEAKSIYGWNNAVVRSANYAIAGSPAKPIGITSGAVTPGPKFFRKDFSVTDAGVYNLTVESAEATDWILNGTHVMSRNSTIPATVSVNLTSGCHTLYVKAVYDSALPGNGDFIGSLSKQGATQPIVITDASWRASAGATTHFASSDYYAGPSSWTPVRYVMPATSTLGAGVWLSRTGNSTAGWISTVHNNTAGSYPINFAYFRDNSTVRISTPTQVRVSYACDDACTIYLNGNAIATGNNSDINSTTLTLTEGVHQFGVKLRNTGGPSAFDLAVVSTLGSVTLAQSDVNWSAASFWGQDQELYSYANNFNPNPPLSSAVASLLVVGGGGGGSSGGGGGGGVIENTVRLAPQSYNVVVGAGGAGCIATSSANCGNGSNSTFDTIAIAVGGGRGGWNDNANAAMAGGSGGGGGATSTVITSGGAGTAGQGNGGGTVGSAYFPSPYPSAGGGGAGGVGSGPTAASTSGNGGIGRASSITGSSVNYGGGGGGATWGGGTNGAGGSGGGGAGGVNGVAGTANTGGGGGGGANAGAGIGGNGGSGVVIISYPTGSMTATGGTITTSGGNTIHRFTTSGTFTVTSIQ